MDQLATVVSVLIALSVASERFVEIIKGWIPFLNETRPDPKIEGRRKSALQLLGVVAGIITAVLASPALTGVLPSLLEGWPGIIALGLLASGGSGFWNSILTYSNKVKDLKKFEVEREREKDKLEKEKTKNGD